MTLVFGLGSTEFSNLSDIFCLPVPPKPETPSPPPMPEVRALHRLSDNLGSLFLSRDFELLADGKIIVSDGQEVMIHKCILAARSLFFKDLFLAQKESGEAKFELRKLATEYEVGFDSLDLVLGYLYSGRVKKFPREVCICADEECLHEVCRPAVVFLLEVLYISFVFRIDELVSLIQRRLLDIVDKVAVDDIFVVIKVANICGKACDRLLAICLQMIVESDIDDTTLEKVLCQRTAKQIRNHRLELGLAKPENDVPNIHVKRIHRALESDDIELVKLLLQEGRSNLDEAYALHYAVAFCDAKMTSKLLDLGLADINRINPRGYTMLHIAAIRKEPTIIAYLLTKGARPLDLTTDGRKALQIAKRQTRVVDYLKSPEEGKPTTKDRLCVEILEQAESRVPILGEAANPLAMAADDIRLKLLYLESRVSLARLLFPVEAKILLHISQADATPEFSLEEMGSNCMVGSTVDLNESPFRIKQEHLTRLIALTKAGELAKKFFPRCSEMINKILHADDISQLARLWNNTPEQLRRKKRRFIELQEVLKEAFYEDKEALNKYSMSSSLS